MGKTIALVVLAALIIPVAAWAESCNSLSFDFHLVKDQECLFLNFDMPHAEKSWEVAEQLQKMGWKKEQLKSGGDYKPDYVLEMGEEGYWFTIQAGYMAQIPLNSKASSNKIARTINTILAKYNGKTGNEPSASVELGRDLIK